jgi:hypothetical protein
MSRQIRVEIRIQSTELIQVYNSNFLHVYVKIIFQFVDSGGMVLYLVLCDLVGGYEEPIVFPLQQSFTKLYGVPAQETTIDIF